MPGLRETQAAFAAAVLTPEGEPLRERSLAEAIITAGVPVERRLAVYRRNVALSLRRVLEGTFPASRWLLGAERFARLADVFVHDLPPERPQLLAYGAGFPDFLERTAEPDRLVADVARLEWAREEAYHAADAPPVTAAMVAAIPIERYPTLRLTPHPSLRLVGSSWPVFSLWREAAARAAGTVPEAPAGTGAEQAMVVRPFMTVTTRSIAAADLVLLEALRADLPLAEAAAQALAVAPDFDLQAALAQHLAGGSFAGCR
jgi:hypothetical protein